MVAKVGGSGFDAEHDEALRLDSEWQLAHVPARAIKANEPSPKKGLRTPSEAARLAWVTRRAKAQVAVAP
jgi:hypothetical protein